MKVSRETLQLPKSREAGTKSGATGWGHFAGRTLILDIKTGLSTGISGRELCSLGMRCNDGVGIMGTGWREGSSMGMPKR